MQTLHIYGASDDLFECEGIPGTDEFGCYNELDSEAGRYMGSALVKSKEGRIRIHVIYDGCWSFAIGKVNEDDSFPEWVVSSTWENYSEHLRIDLPNDAIMLMEGWLAHERDA